MDILLLVFGIAATVYFSHWVTGSPSANSYEGGRLFSIWGRFVTSQWTKIDNRETVRVWKRFADWKAVREHKLQLDLRSADIQEQERLTKEYSLELERMTDRVDGLKKPNPYNMLGACLRCFSIWASFALWVVSVIALGIDPYWIIFGTVSSAMIAARIEW